MKKLLLASALPIFFFFLCKTSIAQGNPAPDQNPAFSVSRDKYMQLADSINQWHRTTFQETYKAFDWYENRMERRNENRRFRQELRLRYGYYEPGGYYSRHYYYNEPYHGYYRYYRPRYRFGFCWF